MIDSRQPGFYRLSLNERRERIASLVGIPSEQLARILEGGGLDAETADHLVENVLGTYALPFSVALNFRVNGHDRLIPMVVEEPSVVAAASHAARMVRAGGGFDSELLEDLMIGQIELFQVPDPEAARSRLLEASQELLERARQAAPGLLPYGGGPRQIEVRCLAEGVVVVHLLVDCRDAMGANQVNSMVEALGPRVAELAGGRLGLRILSNLADRRRVRARCRVPVEALAGSDGPAGSEVACAIEQASRFAELDPYRAATHNKGIMNGIDAVVIATGNDFRAVEAGAHAYAARSGVYRPLSCWQREGDALVGTLELPLALGTVGAMQGAHPGARLALQLLGVSKARDLAEVVGAVGLASNLAALRALGTEGIQRGHMALHARALAVSAGATGAEVDRVVRELVQTGPITLERARELLAGSSGKS